MKNAQPAKLSEMLEDYRNGGPAPSYAELQCLLASPAAASGDELPPLPDFFALGKTRINGVEHGHYSASQMQKYARAAVSAATKPTADLSTLERFDIAEFIDGGAEMESMVNGDFYKVTDVQSLLATKPAAAAAQGDK